MKTFQTSAAWCLGILFISVSLITTGSSEVVGPADPVVALTGDDIILPCSLKPSVSAEDMIVEWTRLNPKAEKVHLYLDSRDSFVDQFPSYRGRTSMFNEELKNGNVSLKLTNVTLSDAGRYRCFIQTLKKETTVQLLVGAVSQPVISIDGTKGWGVVLKCESGGWFPEPQMEWLDSSGTILPADGPPERHRDSEGLYTVRRHVTVNRTGNNRFTCRVNQLEINHLKETEIHVPDEVFPKSQVGLIVGLLIAVAVVVLAASAGVFMWRKHTEEKKCRKQLEKQNGLQGLLNDVTREKDDLQKQTGQLVAAKKQIDELNQNLTGQLEMLSKDKDDVTREKDGLQGQLNDVTREKDGLQGLLNDVTREKDDLQKQTGQLEKLKKDKEKLRNEKDKVIRERGDALFVDRHKDHLIQKVSEGKSIASELHQKDLIPDEMNSQISAAGTSQDQMRLLFLALEEAENTTRVKSAFYRILLDLEPDAVKDLDICDDDIGGSDDDISGSDDDIKNLKKENEKLKKENDDVTRERDELKEELREAKETIQSLSTSPDGQQKTQTPSQKSEGIEGMEMESIPGRKSGPGPGRKSAPGPGRKSAPEMESLPGRKSAPGPGRKSAPGPGRKSAPEMKPLLAAGPQKEYLYDLERGGRDTTEFNYRETIPSGRKSGPEKEMEMKPLLGPGPQKDDLDELERGGRVTTEFNYVL